VNLSVNVTERDHNLLVNIAKYGVLNTDYAKEIYCSNLYYKRRLTKLSKENFIIRKSGLMHLAREGMQYLDNNNIPYKKPPRSKELKKRVTDILRITREINSWEFLPSWEVKADYNFDRGGRYYGMLRSNDCRNLEYLLYRITHKTTEDAVSQLKKKELRNWINRGIFRVIILVENKEALDIYNPEALGLTEQLIIPHNSIGMALINLMGKTDIEELAVKKLYCSDNLEPSKWKDADYQIGEKYIVSLIKNDIEKQIRLKNYMEFAAARHTSLPDLEIVCLESQRQKYESMFIGCSIKTISEDKILAI
jgi:hypothetical protein